MGFPSITIAAFLLVILPVFGLDALRRRGRTAALRALAGIGLAGAACCVVVGVATPAGGDHLYPAGPIRPAAAAVSRAAGYWPYGLILVGSFWIVVYGVAQWSAGRRQRQVRCDGLSS